MFSETEFRGKTALVTGASRGIGRQTAIELARGGCHVIVNYVSNTDAAKKTLDLIEKDGGSGEIMGFDVANYKAVDKSLEPIVKKSGIQILVNNAGITKDKLFVRMSEQDWDDVQSTNLKGVFNCTKAVVRRMLNDRYGRIINITSVVGEMGNPGQINYSSAKAGIIGFTKSAAKEFASRNVTVNAISPGFVETDITAPIPEEMKRVYLESIPLGRYGKAEDISGVVAFLASERASYITGEVIKINGGLYI
ncbi:MAG: 3-oxoacyl-[acyl-carrier-protein] reductase [Candidatus Mycalebacterium zealandia]|nr:MAG: 3-oxoacyl-[acyl-carrier-protein] reductase [Candidatus Mycalebacterium zealandia]